MSETKTDDGGSATGGEHAPAVEYSSNNSGGSWWLSDDDWLALERAGWEVEWRRGTKTADSSGRWLGALATVAKRRGLTLDAAIQEWESVTGACATDGGCPCCGEPHYFHEESGR